MMLLSALLWTGFHYLESGEWNDLWIDSMSIGEIPLLTARQARHLLSAHQRPVNRDRPPLTGVPRAFTSTE